MSAHNEQNENRVMRTPYTYTHLLEAKSLEDAVAHVNAVFLATGWTAGSKSIIHDHLKNMGLDQIDRPTRMLGFGQLDPMRSALMSEPAFAMFLPLHVAVIETDANKAYEVAGIRPLAFGKMMEKADKAFNKVFEALTELDSEMAATLDAIGVRTGAHGAGATEGMKDIHAKEQPKNIKNVEEDKNIKQASKEGKSTKHTPQESKPKTRSKQKKQKAQQQEEGDMEMERDDED